MKTNKKKNFLFIIATILVVSSLFAIWSFVFAQSPAEAPILRIVAKNLSFSDSIYLKYAVSAENVENLEEIKLLVWTEPQESYTVETAKYTLDAEGTSTVSGAKCAIFNFRALAAKQMTDIVYCRAYIVKNDIVFYSETEKYSILQYAYNKLGYTGTPTSNEELYSLLEGMLQYGASAQKYFNYKTNDLATDKHVKITLENGTFADGFNTTLAIPGTTLTVTAPKSIDNGGFVYWCDVNGKIVSTENTFEITVGEENYTLSAVYEVYRGGAIDSVGANTDKNSFANTEHLIDTSNATDVSSSELENLLANGLTSGSIYRVNGDSPIRITSNVDGKNSVIISNTEIIIENSENITVKNLFVIGNVSIVNSNNVTFDAVEIQGGSTALSADQNSSNITVNNCRIISTENGIFTQAFNTSILNSYLSAKNAVTVNANEATVFNNTVMPNAVGISVRGEDNAVNNNTVTSKNSAKGIIVGADSLNTLISYNKTVGPEYSIEIENATNTVVLFNSVYNINAKNNISTYVVKNSLGGQLKLTDNNYLLCDANSYTGSNNHAPSMSGNQNTNGDSLMDVTARNKVGANEDLLPHTNKDLFIGMELKETVKDVASGTSYSLDTYIEKNAENKSIVIVPPGAYSTAAGDMMTLDEKKSNTEIYAFGVYNEHGFITNEEYLQTKKTNYILDISGASNISIHGITQGYNYQSSGQVHVLEKLGNDQILVIPAAGYDIEAGFGLSNPGVFRGSAYIFDPGALAPWCEFSYTVVRVNDDGTLVLQINYDHSIDELDGKVYEMTQPGSVLCTRMAGDNQRSVSITNSNNILMKDCVLNGYAAALAHVVTGRSEGIKLERVHNCAKAPFLIDQATYEMYEALEKKYNVDLEIYIDSEGRYRGSRPRFGSVDATHISGAYEGLYIESCLFENSCDDGSNQRGSSNRLHSIVDNKDGTSTIYFKGMVTKVYHGMYAAEGNVTKSLTPSDFAKGDNVFIYTSKGEVVCDTVCLSASRAEDSKFITYHLGVVNYNIYVKSITVPTSAVNFDALEGFNLEDNHYDLNNKVIVDNISRSSAGFVVDNLVVRNSHARGVLAKTVNATIKNSTFQNIKAAGVLLNCEPEWGESTISRNINIINCLFDNTGFANKLWSEPKNAPIFISSLNTYGNANVDSLLSESITITGCEFKNYGHNFGIYVNGAKDVHISDNIFDPANSADPGCFIQIKTALNVEISGNKYRDRNGKLSQISGVVAEDYVNVYGSDVEGQFVSDCDIYIAGNHISQYRIVPDSRDNKDIADILARELGETCGYSIASTTMHYDKIIKLSVVNESNSSIDSSTYSVKCENGILIITAQTRAALAYAVEDFAQSISELNRTQQSIYFNEGYSSTKAFSLNNMAASHSVFKYTGIWNSNGSSMISGSDADYVEFNFTGSTITLLFGGNTTFKVSFDGNAYTEYTVESEKTLILHEGTHTARITVTDHTKPISFLGIKTYSSSVDNVSNKEHYIQFIGDSMVDYDSSFAHNVADLLNWDYSVIVGDSIPATSVTRKPDIVVVFLGTDELSSASTQAQINTFIAKYDALVASIYSKYGNNTMVYALQALSTSNASDMFNTSNARYVAINTVASTLKSRYGNKFNFINAATVSSWNIDFDTSVSTTIPTTEGNYKLFSGISKYILNDYGANGYINYVFPHSSMAYFNNDPTTSISRNQVEDGITFTRYSFGVGGHAWINGNDAASANVGNSGRYLVIKYRTSGEANLTLEVRTNDYGRDQSEYGRGYLSSAVKSYLYTPTEWEVAVVDLAQFEHYTPYVNERVQLRISTEADILDIAYVALVDDISEARMVTMFELGDTQYAFYEDWSQPAVLFSLNGEPPKVNEKVDLSHINHIFNINLLRAYNGSISFSLEESGVTFTRINFDKNGHVFFKGDQNGNYTGSIDGSTGSYIIIKYRATNNDSLQLDMQTEDTNPNGTGSTMSKVSKPASLLSTEWEVAVIDLAQFPNYTKDSMLDVRIRFTTSVKQIDIAYAAIVDDTSEAEDYISAMGDSSYVYYVNWATAGTVNSIE